jgi:hypothetical protein
VEVAWTETALETLLKVIDYLFDYWTIEKVEGFQLHVDQLIERVASFNQICPESNLFTYQNAL